MEWLRAKLAELVVRLRAIGTRLGAWLIVQWAAVTAWTTYTATWALTALTVRLTSTQVWTRTKGVQGMHWFLSRWTALGVRLIPVRNWIHVHRIEIYAAFAIGACYAWLVWSGRDLLAAEVTTVLCVVIGAHYAYGRLEPTTKFAVPKATWNAADPAQQTIIVQRLQELQQREHDRRLRIAASPGLAVACYIGVGHLVLSHIETPTISYALLGLVTLPQLVFYGILFALVLKPNVVRYFTNNPNRNRPPGVSEFTDDPGLSYPPSIKGCFTNLLSGHGKWIWSGGKPIRAIINYAGYMLLGNRHDNDLQYHNRAYWEVVPSRWTDSIGIQHEGFSHPIPFPVKDATFFWVLYSPWSILWWLWKLWMYKWNGVVFTGISPWRYVLVYPLEHYRQATIKGRITAQRRFNYTDFFSLAPFQIIFTVSDVNTNDKVPLRVLVSLICRIFNLHLAAFDVEPKGDWFKRVITALTSAVTRKVSILTYGEVVARTEATKNLLADNVRLIGTRPPWTVEELGVWDYVQENITPTLKRKKKLEGPVCAFGVMVEPNGVEILDVSASDPETEKKLGGLAQAEVEAQSIERRGQAEANVVVMKGKAQADVITQIGEAVKNSPGGQTTQQIDGIVRAVEAAQPGTIIQLHSSGAPATPTGDPNSLLLLAELQKLVRVLTQKGGAP